MEKDFDKENDLEDTLYFDNGDKSYESKQKPYSEDDMYEEVMVDCMGNPIKE